METVPSGQEPKNEPGWLSKNFRKFTNALTKRSESDRVLTENELAFKKMASIGRKITDLLEGPDFKEIEKRQYLQSNSDLIDSNVFIPQGPDNQEYSINIQRDTHSKQPFMIEVYVSPSDKNDYSTGNDDGYFRIYLDNNLSWSNTAIKGDACLGKETNKIIEELSIDHLSTQVNLRGVDFGGYPTIHVTLNAFGQGRDGKNLGPIGKIRELNILGIARAKEPVEGHIMDSKTGTIQVDEDFARADKPFIFDRGGANFQAVKKVGPGNKELLALRFSGIRTKLSGDREHPTVVGPEIQEIAIPMDLVDGFKVIDIFDKAVDGMVAACKEQSKLEATNP